VIKSFIAVYCSLLLLVPGDLKKLRAHYVLMSKKEESALLIKDIATQNKDLPRSLTNAYIAAAEMALAQYKFSPAAKLSNFNNGRKLLEAAVRSDSVNLEVRYIRFTIQCNAPKFLGYTKNIIADKNFLVQNLKTVKTSDTELFSNVYAYLLASGKLSAEDKTALSKN